MSFLRHYQLNIMLSLSSICGIIAVFVLITGVTTRRKKALLALEISAMVLLMADRYAYIYRGNVSTIGYWMVRISNYLVYSLTIGLVFLFNQYLKEMFLHASEKNQAGRKRMLIVDYASVVDELMIFASQFTGLFYTFDETNHYQREPAYIISYIIPLLSMFLQLSIIVQYFGQLSKSMRLSLFIFTFAPVVASLFQFFAYGLSLTNMTLVGVVVLLYIIDLIDLKQTAKSSRRIAERLHTQLASAAEIYRSAYDIDLTNDTFSEMITNNRRISDILGDNHENAQKTFFSKLDQLTAPSSKEDIMKFIDFSTLEERLKNRRTITLEFLTAEGVWLRGRFIASQYGKDGKISHVLWMLEDIDEEKKKREELINLSERAVAANEAKSAFLSNMSHEIRTPINAVLGMNEMILRESREENIIEYSENIQTAGQTLLGLINDILDFSKIEAGKIEIIPVDYDLSSVINDLVIMTKARAEKKGLVLELDFDRRMPKMLNGDEIRVKQIITNILTNAVKYTEKGSIHFRIGFEKIQQEPEYALFRVSVKDTGIGINEEDMPKLFSKFERIEESRNRNIEGTGLGMSITQSLLSMMGSHLEVRSTYGEGSEFFFTLKQRVVKWDVLGDYESEHQTIVHNREKYREKFVAPEARVLVVDDNPMNLTVFQSLLKHTRIDVERAKDGYEGIEKSSTKKYDVIFLDHMMPGKDGIETLHEIMGQKDNPNRDTPVICLTANAISGAREQYVAAGFSDYLPKPIDSAKLEEMLMEYLPADKIISKLEEAHTDLKSYENSKEKKRAVQSEVESARLEFLRSYGKMDVSAGIYNCGSVDGYLSMLKVFYDTVGEKLEEITSFYESGDLRDYVIKVHALKSSARIIGAGGLGEEAQKLENAGRKNDVDYIREHHFVFLSNCRELVEKLKESCKETEKGSGGQQISVELLRKFYEEIRQAAEDMDIDRVDEIIKRLDGYDIPQSEKMRYGKVKAATAGFDYDEIIKVLSQEDLE